jgi:uncharacterized protein YkwD
MVLRILSFRQPTEEDVSETNKKQKFSRWRPQKQKWGKLLSAPGAFCSAIPRAQNKPRFLAAQSDKTDATWQVCDSKSYHDHSPLMARRQSTRDIIGILSDEATELNTAMARARKLPGPYFYSNNIILVNKARCVENAPALSRDMELDHIARSHAEIMAMTGIAGHSDPTTLRFKLSGPCRRIGENVAVGTSIKDVHKEMMESPKRHADKNNILDRRYTCMGVGTSKGKDGKLYICQVFKG